MVTVPKALFVDGHSLAYRAFFALPDTLATAEGQPTNAVLGFAQMLLRILDEEKPDYLAVAFDKGRPTFRLDEFADYKAQRKPTPDKLRPQFGLIKEFLGALGATVIEVEGWEGDDILAALTDLAKAQGVETLILTGDRDTLQLVGPGVKAIITLRGISETVKFDAAAVEAKYGVPPAKLPDLKGLVGDPSDNLPGVPGIGEKTASSLLAKFGSLDNLLDHVDEVTPERVRKALAVFAADARTCRSLATIRHDVPFESPPDLNSLRRRPFDRDKMAEFLRRLEFRSLLRRLGLAEKAAGQGAMFAEEMGPGGDGSGRPSGAIEAGGPGPGAAGLQAVDTGVGRPGAAGPKTLVRGRRVARTREDLSAVAGKLARVSRLALAAGLDGERPLEAKVEGFAIAADGLEETVYVPLYAGSPTVSAADKTMPLLAAGFGDRGGGSGDGVGSPDAAPGGAVDLATFLDILGPILAATEPAKLMHGAKPFRVWLAGHLSARHLPDGQVAADRSAEGRAAAQGGATTGLAGLVLDTELGAYVLDSSRPKYTLESVVRELTGQDILLPASPPEGWSPAVPGLDWPAERLCLQADMTLAAADPMRAELHDKDLDALIDDMEMPLQGVLAEMELAGVGIDGSALKEMSAELGRRIADLEKEVYELAGQEFNLNSPRQLGDVLFGKLKLPAGRKTATGAYSTNAEVLEELAESHDVVAKILDHRQLTKLKGTYTDGMAALINPVTGRIHTVFKQTVAATGRLSSTEPNLQNIPIREEEGRRIRRVFVPAPGHVFLAGDYSQIELRLMAHLSGDAAFIEAFRRGEDIHRRTASEIFGVPIEDVTPELRSRAKAVNFGIIYGVSDFGLARNTGVPRAEAAAFIEQYLDRYPGIRSFVDRTLAEGRSRGYVTTLWNRRRYLPDLHSSNRTIRQMAERAARNTPIQGTAADIIKLAMVHISREMAARRLASRMILQVHDELLFEAPRDEVQVLAKIVREKMEGVVRLDVPLDVDLKIGENWYEMRKLEA